MPKNVIIAIVVILILGGGAAFFFQNQNKMSGKDAITSIKDTLTKSASMECNYTDEQGRTSKAYIKNGSIRADITAKNSKESGSVIVTDKKIYFWNSEGGFMMEVPDVTKTPSQTEGSNQGLSQKEELMRDLDKYKDYCKNASVSDSLFTPPTDVKFQDYSQMMNQLAPTIGAGAGMSEEQVKQYMQQYGNPQQ